MGTPRCKVIAMSWWSGPVAVISDVFHTFFAGGDVLIALVGQKLSQRQTTTLETFGWARAEIIGALFNGGFLFVMAGYVMWTGAMWLMAPQETSISIMLWAAAGGIVTEVVSFALMYQRQKNNLNMKGPPGISCRSSWEGSSSSLCWSSSSPDFWRSIRYIDPLLGMTFGVILFWAVWLITRSVLQILLQATPEDLDADGALFVIRDIEGVVDVHHIHAWALTLGKNVFSAHIQAEGPAGDRHRILEEANAALSSLLRCLLFHTSARG